MLMQDLIHNLAQDIGTDEATARGALGTLLCFMRDNAEEQDVQALFAQVPEAKALAEEAAAGDADAGGGSGGGLMGMLGGLVGGSMGAAMNTLGRLQDMGLDTGQIGTAGKALFRHLEQQAEPELVRRILDQLAGKVPMLEKFL